MFRTLKEDLDAVMERDPAARSRAEVFFLYSGFKAVRSHRKANWCYRHNLKFFGPVDLPAQPEKDRHRDPPRGADRPGLFIDHGMGVVIGETTQIGDNCTLYQGGHPLGGHRQGHRQAPPHPGGQRAHRRGGQGAGALHRGGQRPGSRRGRGAGRRSGRGHRRGRARPGGAHQRGRRCPQSRPATPATIWTRSMWRTRSLWNCAACGGRWSAWKSACKSWKKPGPAGPVRETSGGIPGKG